MYRSLARAARGSGRSWTPTEAVLARCAAAASPWHALERLAALFGLSSFERDLLVLCAGPSLESRFISGCAAALNDARASWPTFGLALTILDDPHWSAVSPARPLRYWQLVDVDRGNLLHAPLRIDERILQFLIGVPAFDERLQALARPILAGPAPAGRRLPSRHPQAVSAGARHWERPASRARAAPADRQAPVHPAGRLRSPSASAAACGRTGSTRATSPPRPSSVTSSRACGPARRP